MQNTSPLSTCSENTGSDLYESLVLRALKPMKRGRLVLTAPDGRLFSFGHDVEGPRAHLNVRDKRFFKQCVLYGDIGFGESFEAGEWETDDLVAVLSWMIANAEDNPQLSGSRRKSRSVGWLRMLHRIGHRLRDNTLSGSRRNISDHYDLGNGFFAAFLDSSMTYSSALFETGHETLEEAQRKKYDQLCRMLRLTATDHLLEIGTGWGGFALHAAKTYGCRVTTATISREQFDYAAEMVGQEGLQDQVEVIYSDYRNLRGRYDKIASIEMAEAVGERHLKTYFETLGRLLKPDGLAGLQVILSSDGRFEELKKGVDWIQKYIFPGSLIPSLAALHAAANAAGELNFYELKDMGRSYARTLREWRQRFLESVSHPEIKKFPETFRRRWEYYLAYCEAAFATRHITVAQMLLSRPNNPKY